MKTRIAPSSWMPRVLTIRSEYGLLFMRSNTVMPRFGGFCKFRQVFVRTHRDDQVFLGSHQYRYRSERRNDEARPHPFLPACGRASAPEWMCFIPSAYCCAGLRIRREMETDVCDVADDCHHSAKLPGAGVQLPDIILALQPRMEHGCNTCETYAYPQLSDAENIRRKIRTSHSSPRHRSGVRMLHNIADDINVRIDLMHSSGDP